MHTFQRETILKNKSTHLENHNKDVERLFDKHTRDYSNIIANKWLISVMCTANADVHCRKPFW